LLVDGLSQHIDAVPGRYPQSARVLDVGCSDSALRIGKSVGASGEAVGLDCAENT
jgi:ubiquinone/menaquinone biosynthesis C-methylase UbiE